VKFLGSVPAGRLLVRIGIAVILLFGVYVGWKLFWFQTDDAYISFRYVHNMMAGRGLVWNPAPFIPVEGYTSFLWVILLAVIWTLSGVEPPAAANYLALLFGYATLGVGCLLIWKMNLPARLERFRPALLVLVLIGTITNRTFLTWLSSGLETAAFNFFLTWWIYEVLCVSRGGGSWGIFRLSASAALTYLTRPDGILVVLGTVLILFFYFLWEPRERQPWEPVARKPRWLTLLQTAPLLAVPSHLLWRKMTYDEWLPNTYFAKHLGAWPESGSRYAASFLLENGAWVWLLVLLVWVISSSNALFQTLRRQPVNTLRQRYADWIMLAVVIGHAGYYTLIIGGDHFEYRVYSHLVLLLFVSTVWLLSRLTRRIGLILTVLASYILLSYPIPYVHWWETRKLETREETLFMVRPIAQKFPPSIRPVVSQWDDWQKWLISHMVCTRHQEHKIFLRAMDDRLPEREEGMKLKWATRPTIEEGAVGMVGWIFPEVAVIDTKGLNNWIVARTGVPFKSNKGRKMAHDRQAEQEYINCLRPNILVANQQITIFDRELTDQDIARCEKEFSECLD
jgi:arabinofuranosyltransferase